MIGYAIQLGVDPTRNPGAAYFGIFLCVGGVAPPSKLTVCVLAGPASPSLVVSNTISWAGVNLGPVYKKATGLGLMFTTGNSVRNN